MGERMYRINKEDFLEFVDNLIDNFETIGVKEKRGNFVFSNLKRAYELRLDHDITILPPKEFLLPPYEKMMEFDIERQEGKLSEEKETKVLIGLHPYDIIAIKQMDEVYLGECPDELYRQRRENAIIIGSDILNVSEYSFASSLGTHVVENGFDLMLTDLKEKVIIEVGSKRGENLLMRYAQNLEDADERDVEEVENLRRELPSKYKIRLNVEKDQIPFLMMEVFDHPVWEERSIKCLECGSCTIVCPTCYCYDVRDEISLTLDTGKRIRTWDSCLLPDFTKIASGEIFRRDRVERYRHRFYRKTLYIPFRYNFIACVGCGRCIKACIPKVANPADVINELAIRKNESKGGISYKMPKGFVSQSPMIPMPAVIRRIETLTETEKLFEIEIYDVERFDFQPGQFVEVSVFGVGEAPISISSPPQDNNIIELVIRRVGSLTGKLHNMNTGNKLGIRGPLGRGFDIDAMKGKDVLIVAGGIGMVPLRSLIKYILSDKNRHLFGKIFILYGSRTPKDVLFMDEIEKWRKEKDVEIRLSVDTCPDGMEWKENIGVVTTLFSKIDIEDPLNTVAVTVGPPVMYKFVIRDLKKLGIKDENIFVSLERRMKCGIGKCGHCQINGIYVCKEGPVFKYSDIKDLPEAFT